MRIKLKDIAFKFNGEITVLGDYVTNSCVKVPTGIYCDGKAEKCKDYYLCEGDNKCMYYSHQYDNIPLFKGNADDIPIRLCSAAILDMYIKVETKRKYSLVIRVKTPQQEEDYE